MAKTLKTILSMDSKPFADGVTNAKRKMRKFNKEIGGPLAGGAKKLAVLGAVAVTAAVVIGGAGVRSVSNYGDELDKMNKRTGVGVEELARLQHAASLSDTSLESLGKGMKGMALLMYEAKRGTKTYTDVLDELGVNFEDVKDQTPEDQLKTFMGAIAGIENPTRKAALAAKVFGRAGIDLLPMLSGGVKGLNDMKAEADKLGLVISPKQVAAAAKFKDQMTRLKSSVMGVALSSIHLDKINAVIGVMTEKVVALGQSEGFQNFVEQVTAGSVKIIEFVGTVIKTVWNFAKQFGGALKAIAPVLIGTVIAFKTGLAMPLIKLGALIVKGLVSTLVSPLGGVLLGLAAIFAGFKLGEALEKSFDLSNYIAKGLIQLEGFGGKIGAFFKSIGPGFKKDFDAAMQQINSDTESKLDMLGPAEGNGKGVGENFMDGMKESFAKGKGKMAGIMEKLLPDFGGGISKFKLPSIDIPGITTPEGALAGAGDAGIATAMENGVERGVVKGFDKMNNKFYKVFGGGGGGGDKSTLSAFSKFAAEQKKTNGLLKKQAQKAEGGFF